MVLEVNYGTPIREAKMNLRRISIFFAPLLVVGAIAVVQLATPAQSEEPAAPMQPGGGWGGMMMGGWGNGGGRQGMGPLPRHHLAMMSGIPAPYTDMTNPLPRTEKTLRAARGRYRL